MLGNGSDELIALLCATFAEPRAGQARARSPTRCPASSSFARRRWRTGSSRSRCRSARASRPTRRRCSRRVARERPNLLFLATPNNPTGTLWPRSTVARLIEQHPDVIIVVDEAYLAYCDAKSCADLALAHANCVVLQTLSKIGLAALRVGMLVGQRELLAAVEKVRPPYNLSDAVAARGGRGCSSTTSRSSSRTSRRSSGSGARSTTRWGSSTGLEVFPSGGNFLLVRAREARALHDALVERGVLVRLFDAGLLAGCMRITVGTPDENSWLLDAIKASIQA